MAYSWLRGAALDDDGARRVTELLHDQLVRGDGRAQQLDAWTPAAEQLALFAAVGWPDGLPSASFFKDRALRLAGERHRYDLDRISARHPGYRVHFPKNIAQFANARPDMGCEWGDPVYWLTRASDEVGPGRRRWLELLRPTGGGLETVEQREAIAMALSAEATPFARRTPQTATAVAATTMTRACTRVRASPTLRASTPSGPRSPPSRALGRSSGGRACCGLGRRYTFLRDAGTTRAA